MIYFTCDECGADRQASSRYAGELLRCRKCDAETVVPDSSTRAKPEKSEVAENLYVLVIVAVAVLLGVAWFVLDIVLNVFAGP